jgi:hypothetical protein
MGLEHHAIREDFLPEAVTSRTYLAPTVKLAELFNFCPSGRSRNRAHMTEVIYWCG